MSPLDVTEAAWARFTRTTAIVAELSDASRVSPTTGVSKTSAFGALYGNAAKWLVIGALGGALTASWMAARSAAGPVVHQPLLNPNPPSLPPSAVELSASSRFAPEQEVASATRPTQAIPSQLSPAERRSLPNQDSLSERAAPAAGSTKKNQKEARSPRLAAEVLALDRARTAIARGAPDQALRLLDQYHHEFPTGELHPDAEVVALEARATQGDRAGVIRQAAHFLAQYPNDPHAAAVKRLARQWAER